MVHRDGGGRYCAGLICDVQLRGLRRGRRRLGAKRRGRASGDQQRLPGRLPGGPSGRGGGLRRLTRRSRRMIVARRAAVARLTAEGDDAHRQPLRPRIGLPTVRGTDAVLLAEPTESPETNAMRLRATRLTGAIRARARLTPGEHRGTRCAMDVVKTLDAAATPIVGRRRHLLLDDVGGGTRRKRRRGGQVCVNKWIAPRARASPSRARATHRRASLGVAWPFLACVAPSAPRWIEAVRRGVALRCRDAEAAFFRERRGTTTSCWRAATDPLTEEERAVAGW